MILLTEGIYKEGCLEARLWAGALGGYLVLCCRFARAPAGAACPGGCWRRRPRAGTGWGSPAGASCGGDRQGQITPWNPGGPDSNPWLLPAAIKRDATPPTWAFGSNIRLSYMMRIKWLWPKKGPKVEGFSHRQRCRRTPEQRRTEHSSLHKLCMKLWLAAQVSIR